MDSGKSGRHKLKAKKQPAKTKGAKKRKSEGQTCSTFLTDLAQRLAFRKKLDEEEDEDLEAILQESQPKNIVGSIINSLTHALPPVVVPKKSPEKAISSPKPQEATEVAPNEIPDILVAEEDVAMVELIEEELTLKAGLKVPKMPVVSSEVMKPVEKKKVPVTMQDMAMNTGTEHDVASELAKHVGTLRKISLIAEEFNQKTAKSLKEIVDSVQQDLIKKLEEAQAEQKLAAAKAAEIMEQEA